MCGVWTTSRRSPTGRCCATPTSTSTSWPGTSSWTGTWAAAAVDELLRVGLVSRTVDRARPAPPATTLGSLLHGELRDLEERRAQLESVRATLSGFAADHMVGQSRAGRACPSSCSARTRRSSWSRTSSAVRRGSAVLPPGRGHRRRLTDVRRASSSTSSRRAGRCAGCTRPTSSTTRPAWYVRRWADAGERARPMSTALPPIAVFGDEAAFVSSTWAAGSRASCWCGRRHWWALVRELFEQYWMRGTPLASALPDIAGRRAAAGARADGPGRQGREHRPAAGGLAAHGSAPRRRPDDRAGLDTRFQAGMEAARRGLL